MPDYSWPPMDKRRVMGKRTNRLDGFAKASGKAKYSSDIKRPGLLYGALLTCPHAHARITGIDVSPAEKMKGVTAVEVMSPAGTEVQYGGWEVAAVAALTEDIAQDAVRRIKVDYEVLPHVVDERDLSKVGNRAKPGAERTRGEPDKAFQEAAAVSEGFYGLPVLNHCCLESHGQVIEFKPGELTYWPSTQNVSGIGSELAKDLEIPATDVHTHMDVMGGGFGSKFSHDRWGTVCAKLSKKSGGRAVKLFLDRATELKIAGNRPSDFAKIKLAADKDGMVTGWQSESWSTGGAGGAGMPPIPYVFTKIPHQRLKHTAVQTNAAMQRAWRAPNHPQASYLTMCALDDLAAKLNMDPVEFFSKNVELSARPEVYRSQIQKAAELAQWQKLWHPRNKGTSGTVKRGLGMGINTWGGLGHNSECRTTIHPDGSVEVELGSQDLGTGARTLIAMVAAESLGLPLSGVKVKIGDNRYPNSEASGGSTTSGGVSVSTLRSTQHALAKLFDVVAPALSTTPDQLEAVDGSVRIKGSPSKSLRWKAACRKLGVKTISELGISDPKNSIGLMNQGVGGIQIADVSVDTETGIVKMNRMVAVQDCGLVINPKTAESQCFGACIMSICGALMEERILDPVTGRVLNDDMDFYKLAGIGDVGEIVVHLDITPEHDKRGVIGLGEPPVIGGLGAISNAVANAIGLRVPVIPLTPANVLATLQGRNA
jgi:xanthine dehydrogenase YagR molybdenum-binding subunit